MQKKAADSGVAWRKQGKGKYALDIAGSTIVLQMNYWRSTATVVIDGKTYSIRRRGIWKMAIEITDDADQVIGTFKSGWTGAGTLSLHGRQYHWKFGNWWGTAWRWEDVHGRAVQHHTTNWTWFHSESRVAQDSPMPAEDEAFLAAFGWFLQYLYVSDSGSGAVIVTSAS